MLVVVLIVLDSYSSLVAPSDLREEGERSLSSDSFGQYQDANSVFHAFVREPDGHFITFEAPGAQRQAKEQKINPEGAIVGTFKDVNTISHGFLRNPSGAITSFDVPGSLNNTNALDITLFGIITGYWNAQVTFITVLFDTRTACS